MASSLSWIHLAGIQTIGSKVLVHCFYSSSWDGIHFRLFWGKAHFTSLWPWPSPASKDLAKWTSWARNALHPVCGFLSLSFFSCKMKEFDKILLLSPSQLEMVWFVDMASPLKLVCYYPNNRRIQTHLLTPSILLLILAKRGWEAKNGGIEVTSSLNYLL